jgi:peptidoglycan/xylan/chitin deacetylase (PgdA/CDA1 family)
MNAKQALLGLARVTGAFALFRAMNRQRILVLTYHRFTDSPRPGRTSAADLASQLDYLASHYTVLPLSDIERSLRQRRRLPPATAAVTIDDGYADFHDVAWPILRRRKIPATVFVVTDFVDRRRWIWTDKIPFVMARTRADRISVDVAGTRIGAGLTSDGARRAAAARINAVLKSQPDEVKDTHIDRIAAHCGMSLPDAPPADHASCTWAQLRAMASDGVEIGSHTVTHPILTRVSVDRLRRELEASRERLEQMLSRPIGLFCYPNGAYNRVVRDAVGHAGYRLAVTSDSGLNDTTIDPLAIRRIQNEQEDLTHFVQSTSGFEEAKNALRSRRRAPDATLTAT